MQGKIKQKHIHQLSTVWLDETEDVSAIILKNILCTEGWGCDLQTHCLQMEMLEEKKACK